MQDFFYISKEDIILQGKTHEPYSEHDFIVYVNPNDNRNKIRINTYFVEYEEGIQCCHFYDRGLCDTIDEYKKLNMYEIESQAYGSWMDGAR